MADTFLREHLTGLQDKVTEANAPELMMHSFAIGGAMDLTNGSRGDAGKMSDQLALLTAVIVGDRLGERARHMATCPVRPFIGHNVDGTVRMPWERGTIVPPSAAPESPQNVKTMLLTALAQNMRVLIIGVVSMLTVILVSVVVTRQIAEATGAGVTISDAIHK